MDLNSALFVAFLSAVCVVAYLTPRRVRYIWLLVCSYGFYLYDPAGWQKNLPALGLMLCTTFISYGCALGIQQADKASKPHAKKVYLAFSVCAVLAMLLVCKYLNFFMVNIAGLVGAEVSRISIILPLGISYYTLQTVSYCADVYWGKLPAEKNPFVYALYVSFFPGIVTGPINRAPQMLPQYRQPARFSYGKVSGGLFRVLWGFFKKMVIADNIGLFTRTVFSEPDRYTGPVLLAAALLFAYQLYADFGGCCDIAIGAAQMLGLRFSENFSRPFAAKTFTLFWQRWHISLTSFFRDYVFEPLVWSRWSEKLPFIGRFFTKPPVTSAVLIIYTLSGLWHGADWGYVIWGVLTGALMVLAKWVAKPKERLVKKIPLYRAKYFRGVVQRIQVYLLFSLTLVFFAAALYGGGVVPWLSGIFGGWGGFSPPSFLAGLALASLPRNTLILLAVCIPFVELLEMFGVRKSGTMADWIRRRAFYIRWPLYYALLLTLLFFGAFGQSSFIYQQY